jgi:hypothetical protein
MTKETRIDISDLHSLTIECGQCHTATTYDLGKVSVTPMPECPHCGQKMEQQASAVKTLGQLYQDLRHTPTPMFFRVAKGDGHERQ